jgi:CcmD family protein
MNKLKRIGFTIAFCMMQLFVWAQNTGDTPAEPTDFMRSEGKLYVVVACVVVIVLGIYVYLINLDRKIKKLESKG